MAPPFHPQPKPKKGARIRTKKSVAQAKDRAESAKVKARSEGQCEVWIASGVGYWKSRCGQRATQVHHLIGGRGKRGIGISALAEHKQHVCNRCHLDITGDIGGRKLIREGGPVPVWTDTYRAVRKGAA